MLHYMSILGFLKSSAFTGVLSTIPALPKFSTRQGNMVTTDQEPEEPVQNAFSMVIIGKTFVFLNDE